METSESREATRLLAGTDLFSTFSPDELASLAEKSGILELSPGEAVFRAGDPGDRLFVIAQGEVEIRDTATQAVLAEFIAGDSFGELELLTRGRRTAHAVIVAPARLLAFPGDGAPLDRALSDNPRLAARMLHSFLLVVAGRIRKANALVRENSPWVRELSRQVYGDKLTGLLNRAWLEENLPKRLTPSPVLIMMKPDNFKELNDRFGHEAGDAALCLMARELDRAVAPEGTAVRWMGNELAVLYAGRDRDSAMQAAQSIQGRLAGLDLSAITGDPEFHLSLSLGIGLHPEHGAEAAGLIKAVEGLPLAGRARGGSQILFPEDAP